MTPGLVVWITGRPSSGKSTLAAALQAKLTARGKPSLLLDGDELRELLGAHDYSPAGRARFYATLGALAALAARQGLVVIVPATAHRRAYREQARAASPRFLEIYVTTPVEECARRDPKGLYVRARTDPELELPGLTVAYEPPSEPDVVAAGGHDAGALDAILRHLEPARA